MLIKLAPYWVGAKQRERPARAAGMLPHREPSPAASCYENVLRAPLQFEAALDAFWFGMTPESTVSPVREMTWKCMASFVISMSMKDMSSS